MAKLKTPDKKIERRRRAEPVAEQLPLLDLPVDESLTSDEEVTPIDQLVEIGRDRGYVTIDDILSFFPEAERDIDQLEETYAALLAAGVTYLDDVTEVEEPSDTELADEDSGRDEFDDDGALAAMDADDTVGLYLKEVGRVPLLTAPEEVSLAKRIERGRRAREELARGPVAIRRRRDLQHGVEDGWAAREHLITANSRLVISVAKKYMGRGVPFLDLIQEGNIGLIRAAKKFDYRRGQRLGRDPTTEELAEELAVPPKKVENMIQVARRPLSLETPTDEEEDSVLGDFIQDEESPAPTDTVTQNLLREHLQEVLNTLPPREVRILQLRYGLLDGQSYTLEEVGRKMGVTRERVRQIEAQALSRLRHPTHRRKLVDYLRE